MKARNLIYDLINDERESQDTLWPRTIEKAKQYKFFAPHILVLEEKLSNLRTNWYKSSKEELQSDMVKIAAIAVRALEEVE